MFGGEFGAFQSHQRHFFNEESPAYQQLSILLRLRRDKLALRRGRQYLGEISGNGIDFGLPRMLGWQIRSVIPGSRIFNDQEILLATTHSRVSYSTHAGQIGQETTVESRNGKAVVCTLPAGGYVIYE